MASLVTQMVKNLPAMQETWVSSLGWEDLLEKEMATHSSILAWKIPWTEKPGRLQSMGSQRFGHNWATSLSLSLSLSLSQGCHFGWYIILSSYLWIYNSRTVFCTPLVASCGILILHLVFFYKQLQYPTYCLSLLYIEFGAGGKIQCITRINNKWDIVIACKKILGAI